MSPQYFLKLAMIVRTILTGSLLARCTITSAFQYHSTPKHNNLTPHLPSNQRFPRPPLSTVTPIFLSASEKETSRSVLIVIETLLESGNIQEAVSELRHHQSLGVDVTSSVHAVIQACCAGGGDDKKSSNEHRALRNQSSNDRLEIALSLLNFMTSATPHAYEILIAGYSRRGRWSDASKLLTEMEGLFDSGDSMNKKDADIVPTLNTYQIVLASLAQGGQYDKMMSLLTKMRRRGVKPNVKTFNTLLNICARDNPSRWKEALSLLSQCQREPGVNPDLVTYTTAMR